MKRLIKQKEREMFALFPDPSGSWVPKGTYEYTVYVVLPLIGVRWSDVDEKKNSWSLHDMPTWRPSDPAERGAN